MNKPLICLGSASPRRLELLVQIGLDPIVAVADIDETPHSDEAAEVYVLRMALTKAREVKAKLELHGHLAVLGADTAVVIDGEILGKPRNKADGLAMLSRLSGRTHLVLTAVALVEPGDEGREATRLSVSHVSFRKTSEQERQAYWDTGEPCDKAGAYGIQGYAAAFVERIEGSYSGVMGLPLYETEDLLSEFGVKIFEHWE